MPYTRSIARLEFQQTTRDLEKQTKFASLKKNHIPHDIQQCVYRNTIFQASAALEEYMKSLLEDWIHLLHVHNKTTAKVPKELILWAVSKKQRLAYQNFIVFGDEGKLINSLSKLSELPALFHGETLVKDVMSQSEHIRDRKYPSRKNITALFRRFGVNDIFSVIERKGRKNYKHILDSFSDVRTAIAHEHPTPDLTPRDIKNQLASINDMTGKVDMVMYSHVVSISGEDCWKLSRL